MKQNNKRKVLEESYEKKTQLKKDLLISTHLSQSLKKKIAKESVWKHEESGLNVLTQKYQRLNIEISTS